MAGVLKFLPFLLLGLGVCRDVLNTGVTDKKIERQTEREKEKARKRGRKSSDRKRLR